MSGTPAQHTLNAAIAAAPAAAWWARFPEIVTVAVGCLAFIYYAMVIAEKGRNWYRAWAALRNSARRVAVKELEKRHAD